MRVRNRSRLTMLAGWLFADLFLVLLVASLASMPATSTTSEKPAPPPHPSTTATPPHPAGLDPHYLDFTIPLSPNDFRAGAGPKLVNMVNDQLSHLDPTHRTVGFALVFASDDQGHISRATATATAALTLLHDTSPRFTVSTGLGYWNGQNNDFEFKIFLLD